MARAASGKSPDFGNKDGWSEGRRGNERSLQESKKDREEVDLGRHL